MLKTQFPTDYLKKEGEAIEPLEEEQRIEQMANQVWQQKYGLKRLKRSDDSLKLPDNFEIGQAIGGGDCFFDSVAKGLKQIKGDEEFTVKLLREFCHKYALENEWVKTAVVNDARLKSHIPVTTKDNDIWNAYLLGIRYTADDIERMKISSEQVDKDLYRTLTRADYGETLVAPIWGRSEIEGRIICERYDIKLHVVEKHIIEGKEIWTNQIVDESGSRSMDTIDYNEVNTIHMVNKGHLHFEPILNTVQQENQHSHFDSNQSKSDQKLEFNPGSSEHSEQARKFKKNKSNRGGTDYELVLSMLVLKRATENQYEFELATERTEDEKFDDLFFKYGTTEKKIYLLQAKYTDDTVKKIAYDDLKTQSDTKFSLPKYFNSYRKIKEKGEFKKDLENLNFIICTTIHFDSDDLKKIKNSKSIEVIEVEENDGIFKKDNKELGKRYKLKINTNEEKQDVFKDTYSSLREMTDKLAECILEDKNINIEQLPILKRYHIALGKEIINTKKAQFYQNFLFLNDSEKLSEKAKEFRKIFYELTREFLKEKQDSLEKLHAKERGKAEKILADFREIIDKGLNDETAKDAFWKKLEGKKLKLVGSFGKFEIKDNKKFIEEFTNIIKTFQGKTVEVNKNTNFGKNINKLGGYILTIKSDVIKFNEEFLKNKKLPASFEEFRNQLKEKLGEKDFAKLDQSELKFNFKNEDNTKFFKEKIYWDLDDDYLESEVINSEIDEFLKKLVFVVTSKVDELKEAIKNEMEKEFGQMNGDNIYNTLNTKIVDWINYRDKEGNGYYLSHEDNVYDKAKNLLLGSVWFDVKKPVDLFTGRKQELSDLHNKIQRNSEKVTVISQMTSVSGLGGIGKTELARQYIHEHSEDYGDNVVWINAESEATLIESFRRLAQDKLRISTKNIDGKEKDIKSIVEEVYKFFAKRKSLFVFDNAEKSEKFNQFLPRSALSPNDNVPYILVTSRNQEWGIEVLSLNELKLEDAIEFIKKGLNIPKEDVSQDQEIENLVKKLQCFPLALQQAVAYIKERDKKLKDRRKEGFEISDYLEEYKEKTKELLNSKAFQGIDNDYAKTTFTTWKITTDKIKSDEQHGQLASEILDIMAYFAPIDIPVEEIFSNLVIGGVVIEGEKLWNAVELLSKYSMINLESGKSSIHRLVQEVTRLELKGRDKEEETLKKSFELLEKSFPYGSDKLEDYPKKQQLLPHFEAFLSNIDDWIKKDPAKKQTIEETYVEDLLIRMGNGYDNLGSPRRRKELLERALPIMEKHYGCDHVKVAETLGNLGNTYGDLGDSQKQKELLEQALVIDEKHYGKDHFEVARTLVNLGLAYGALGDHNKQKELLEQASPILEKHYGPGHFEVAKLLANLGNVYWALGDHHKQKELLEQALVIDEKHYGKDHFEVAKLLTNLGVAYGALGDSNKQKELLERALVIEEKHYGRDHFQVAELLLNLSNVYGALGDHKKQKELLERALPILESHYGKDHFQVAKLLTNLGKTYGDLGDPNKAKELLERALPILEKHYGPEYFEVAGALVNLGNAYGALGDHNKQKELLERALTVQERYYGSDHFEVASTLVNLGDAYGDLGDPHKAKELLERALPIMEKHYGCDHVKVAETLGNLGKAYGDLGDHNKQKELLERALEIKEKHYGKDHFEVASTLYNLGNAYFFLGNPNKQKELLEQALPMREKHYGHDHFEVATLLTNLGAAYVALGYPSKAKELLERALEIFEKHYGRDHFQVAELLLNLSNVYGALGDHKKQKELLERALPILESHYGKDHFQVAKTRLNLGVAYMGLGDINKAKELFEQALPIFEKHYGPNHEYSLIARKNIAVVKDALEKQGKVSSLHEAASSGNLDQTRNFIARGDDFNAEDKDGKTPLHLAAENGHLDTVKYLIEDKKADLNVKSNDGSTPLHSAAQNGKLDIVKYLIEQGSDILARNNHDTVLHQAVSSNNQEVIRFILEKIREKDPQKMLEHINAPDNEGDTPLMWAAQNGKVDAARILLKYGADINAKNNDGEAGLHWAVKGGYKEVVQLLLDNSTDPNVIDKNGKTPLDLAQEKLAQDPENENLKAVTGLLLSVTGKSKSQQPIEKVSELEECLPSTSLGNSGRRKREAKECELSWEDVDEFNEEKENVRDFSKIKINSDRFVNYIKSGSISENKLEQLVQLADKVKVTGKFQDQVNKLISNQKVMNHFKKAERISGYLMHGVMAKATLVAFFNGDNERVAINLGFIAGVQGLAKVAEAVSLKGTGLVSNGKLLLGRSLKMASPFLARGTSAFIAYDLINQIKELNAGNKDVIVGIVGDSIYLGVDAAEIGIEVAEGFEILEGVSSITGPIGAVIGTVVFVGIDVYLAVKKVNKINEIVHLTGKERFIEGLRAFIGMKPEPYVKELIEEKQLYNQLVKQGLEYLKQHNDIKRYVFPTGKSVIDSCRDVPYKTSVCVSGGLGGGCSKTRTVTRYAEECTTKFQVDLDNKVLLNSKRTDIKWNRAKPDNPNEGELFCLPEGSDEQVPSNGAYLCDNAIGIESSSNKAGNYTFINLGEGNDNAKGFKDSSNIFLVNDGFKELHGGGKNDIFILQGNIIEGSINGGGGSNTIDLGNFASGTSVIVNLYIGYIRRERNINNSFEVRQINKVLARKEERDVINCGCDTEYVDGKGGKSNNEEDMIVVPPLPNCHYKTQLVLRPHTSVYSYAHQGNFSYVVLPGKGRAKVILPTGSQSNYKFWINCTLRDIKSIEFNTNNVVFSFLIFSQANYSTDYNSTNSKFDITISYDTANSTFYVLRDSTEIKVGSNSLYALQNSNGTVDEIISDYPSIANRLKMSIFVRLLLSNETIAIGHGNHDVLHNNPFYKSHLVGNGGENIYVITCGHKTLSFDELPIPEIVVYDIDTENSIDTLDLRWLKQQVKKDFNSELVSRIMRDDDDILIKLFIVTVNTQNVATVRLRNALVNGWHDGLRIILDNVHMKIEERVWLDSFYLRPLPIVFSEEIIVVTSKDIAEENRLVIPKKAGDYIFARSGNDLIITNAFNSNLEICTISLSNFYQEAKMQTLTIKFIDKEILLKNEIERINNANTISEQLEQHKNATYDSVFNKNITTNINSIANYKRKRRDESTVRGYENNNDQALFYGQNNANSSIKGQQVASGGSKLPSSTDLYRRKRRDENEVKGYEGKILFYGQNNANSSIKGQQVASGASKLSSTNSGSRPSFWITDFFGRVKNSIVGFLAPTTEQVNSNIVQPEISSVFVDGFLILSDVGVRTFTGNKYKQPKHDSLLSPKELIERRMDHTAIDAINNFEKVCDDKYNNDFQNVTNKVYDKPMTCLNNLSLEKLAIQGCNRASTKGVLCR